MKTPKPFQRIGSLSNAHVGRDFEAVAVASLAKEGIRVAAKFPVQVGISELKKTHSFDLGSEDPPVIVECKCKRWTTGGNVASAKVTVWNEAMYYFHSSPPKYRKILFTLHHKRNDAGETLAEYYLRTYAHLIPPKVEVWEYNEATSTVRVLHGT